MIVLTNFYEFVMDILGDHFIFVKYRKILIEYVFF